MKSDLSAAHLHLERAFYYLCGNDQFSRQARRSINALMDGILSVGINVPELNSTGSSVDDRTDTTTRGLH